MAFLSLQDINNHSVQVNLDQISTVHFDQGTAFIYYSVDENGPIRITSPVEQAKIVDKLTTISNYFDARVGGVGYFINMNTVKFTDYDQGTSFVYFSGNSGPKSSVKVTDPVMSEGLTDSLTVYRGGVGGGGSRWMRRRGV